MDNDPGRETVPSGASAQEEGQAADGVVWEEPARSRGHGRYLDLLEQLTQAPGRWARLGETDTPGKASSKAQSLRSKTVQIPPGRWEFTSRTEGTRGVVYARYLGPDNGVAK